MGTETREAAVAYVDMEVKGGESIRQAVTAAAKKFGLKSEYIRSFYRRRKKQKIDNMGTNYSPTTRSSHSLGWLKHAQGCAAR
jgi:hypothetical protein